MYVPCGKCAECQRRNQSDWFVRCFYQWLDSSRGGEVYFYTLTYNEEHLPKFCGVPCFRKRDLQLFLKKLRKRLNALSIRLKYIITCEYGELRGRPHYHLLFFLSGVINPVVFYNIIQSCWSVSRRSAFGFIDTESRGFVQYGKRNMGRVEDSSAIQYVTKYVSKDMSFINPYFDKLGELLVLRYNRLLSFLCKRKGFTKERYLMFQDGIVRLSKSDKSTPYDEIVLAKCRSVLRNLTPFHMQSSKLGISLLDKLDSNHVNIHSVPIMRKDGKVDYRPLPRYFKRKLWYDLVESETTGKKTNFVLNEDGMLKYFTDVERNVAKSALDYERVSTFVETGEDVCSQISDDTLILVNHSLNQAYKFGYSFHTKEQLFWFLRNMDLDPQIYGIYRNVFRGRCCLDSFDNFMFDADTIKMSWKNIVIWSIDKSQHLDLGKIENLYKKDKDYLNKSLFEFHPFFAPYEFVAIVLDAIDIGSRSSAVKVETEKERVISVTRQLFTQTEM